jgi:hypothetical protein
LSPRAYADTRKSLLRIVQSNQSDRSEELAPLLSRASVRRRVLVAKWSSRSATAQH